MTIQKLPGGSLESEFLSFEEMIFKVLLILLLYIGIFVICFRFKHVIKALSEIDELLNVLLPDTDEGGKEENRRDFLINAVNKGKGDLLAGKIPRTVARI